MKRLIIGSILIVGIAVCLSVAEGFLFDFYQETIAEKWINLASVPLFIYLLIALAKERWKFSFKEGSARVYDIIKYAGSGILGLWLCFYFLLVPAISGMLLIINSFVGEQNNIKVTGIITHKTAFSMQGAAKYEVKIQTITGELTLESNGIAIKNYEVGSLFEQTFEKGSLGLLTKRKN